MARSTAVKAPERGRSADRPARSRWSDRANESVPLAPGAELQHSARIEIAERDGPRLAVDHRVVEARAAAPDQSPRLAIGGRQPGSAEQLEHRDAARELVARHLDLRQFAAAPFALEDGACGFGR